MKKDARIGDFGQGGMRITFGDFRTSPRAKDLVNRVLDSNWISGGPMTNRFEREWGEHFGYKYNVSMSSGTTADMAAAMMLHDYGAKQDDEVIVPALAFAAVGNSVWHSRLKPVFVDIERETLNINPDKIEEKITPKTRAIMAVHTMGKPCDMDRIMKIANDNSLKVIEDCCEAHGAKYRGNFVGGIGDVGAFSFYVAHIITCGNGGMVSTNSEEAYDVFRSIKSHGREPGELYFNHVRPGLNFRMDDLTAAIGVAELENFDQIFSTRKDNLNYLLGMTQDLEEYAHFTQEAPYEVVSPHAFSVTLRDSKLDGKRFHDYLRERGIDCKRNFGSMPTQHQAFQYFSREGESFPEAEYVGDNGVHFGIHQRLSKADLDYCSEVLHDYFKKV